MYPSKPNASGDSSAAKDSDTSKSTAPYPTSSEKQGAPPTEYGYQSSNPSAPLLPSSPYNPAPANMEPPSYSSVVGQESNDWKNRSNSFSAGNNLRPYPPGAPQISGSKSTSGLDSQAPYPPGPGPTSQAPYQTGGYPSYGPPAQAPYPTSHEKAGTAPYPSGPGLGSEITSQPPYSASSGYMPGPASQAPYPVGAMPMPAPVDTNRQIGFTAPVTIEPQSNLQGYQTGGYSQGPTVIQQPGMQQQGLIYPTASGENNQYIQSQYVPNQYGQQQQPTTVYVVQKPTERADDTDDCCLLACCLASCYCICECIKCCVSDS